MIPVIASLADYVENVGAWTLISGADPTWAPPRGADGAGRAVAPVGSILSGMTRRTVAYGSAEAQVYDVHEPAIHSRGLTVALVHGGFWRARYDRFHLVPLATALAADGFHVALLEYARVGMPGGDWPGPGADVVAGLRAVVADPALPRPVVAVGHSAGGHLVVLAASARRVPGLAGAVALAGVVDLRCADALHLGADAVHDLLGGPEHAQPARWSDADPARHRLTAPTVLLVGAEDDHVPPVVAEAYLASRTHQDAGCRLVRLAGAGHFDLIDPGHPAYRHLIDAVTSLAAG